MKPHPLTDKSKYPQHHVWVTASKLNVYSTEQINVGDTIDLKGESLLVTKSSASKSNEEYASSKTIFYELEVAR